MVPVIKTRASRGSFSLAYPPGSSRRRRSIGNIHGSTFQGQVRGVSFVLPAHSQGRALAWWRQAEEVMALTLA